MKHFIKIESTPHGVLGVRHAGLDQQYCEAGELVILKWQPDAKWGLQEAHYTDGDGNIVPIDLGNGNGVVAFMMPDKDITIGGTFKRFVIEDWTGRDAAFSIVGSFDVDSLPTLDGFNDAGKVAFVKDTRKYATWDGYGWTYIDGKPVTPRYLTFTANEDGVSLAFFFNRNNAGDEQQNPSITFQKSTDGGLTWEEHTIGVYDPDDGDTSNLDAIALDEGESVMFKGVNSENFTVGDPENDEGIYVGFYLDGSVSASGDITSLLNGVGGDATIQFMQFYSMFQGCTGLTQAPALPATTLANSCYDSMFSGCTGITSHDVATLNNSTNTFSNNTSCASLTIHAETPPTIGNSTITGLKADCVIYVPAASVDAYKAAQNWSARAAYIQAIP